MSKAIDLSVGKISSQYELIISTNSGYLFNPSIYKIDSAGSSTAIIFRFVGDDNIRRLGQFKGNIIGDQKNQHIEIDHCQLIFLDSNKYHFLADPRVCRIGKKNYVIANTGHSEAINKMLVREVDGHGDFIEIDMNFDRRDIEKNWTFFDGCECNYFIYSYSNFYEVKKLTINKDKYFSAGESYIKESLDFSIWENNYGQVRGGTPAINVGDKYISIFQSSIQSSFGLIYHMGYIEIDKKTLLPTRMSRHPIVDTLRFIELSPKIKLNKKIYACCYPAGLIFDGSDTITLSFGINDFLSGFYKFSLKHIGVDQNTFAIQNTKIY